MCTVLLPPDDNPIAVNKYICIYIKDKTDALIQDDSWTQMPPSIQSDKWIH